MRSRRCLAALAVCRGGSSIVSLCEERSKARRRRRSAPRGQVVVQPVVLRQRRLRPYRRVSSGAQCKVVARRGETAPCRGTSMRPRALRTSSGQRRGPSWATERIAGKGSARSVATLRRRPGAAGVVAQARRRGGGCARRARRGQAAGETVGLGDAACRTCSRGRDRRSADPARPQGSASRRRAHGQPPSAPPSSCGSSRSSSPALTSADAGEIVSAA